MFPSDYEMGQGEKGARW